MQVDLSRRQTLYVSNLGKFQLLRNLTVFKKVKNSIFFISNWLVTVFTPFTFVSNFVMGWFPFNFCQYPHFSQKFELAPSSEIMVRDPFQRGRGRTGTRVGYSNGPFTMSAKLHSQMGLKLCHLKEEIYFWYLSKTSIPLFVYPNICAMNNERKNALVTQRCVRLDGWFRDLTF